MMTVSKDQVIECGIGEKDKNEIQREHIKQVEEKLLYKFGKATKNVCGTKSYAWLKKGELQKKHRALL